MEAVLSAIAFCVKLLAMSRGFPLKELECALGSFEATRIKKYTPPKESEQENLSRNEVRRAFFGAALKVGLKEDK